MRFFVVALALVAGLAVARADDVEVIQLKYRTAEQVIPTLRPMVEPGGAISGMQSTLVIRASRANLAQLKQIVASLDTMPRRLIISVRQDAGAAFEQRAAGVSGTIGGDVRVGINEPAQRRSGVAIGAIDARGSVDHRVTSQVQALEGSPAFIAAGQSVPVRSTVVTPAPGGPVVQHTTSFQNLNTGFYVIPRVSGDRVFLEISPQRATPGRQGPGSANYQQIVTTASGRLGEWIPLGGIGRSGASSQSGVLQESVDVRASGSSVWVKVDEIQ